MTSIGRWGAATTVALAAAAAGCTGSGCGETEDGYDDTEAYEYEEYDYEEEEPEPSFGERLVGAIFKSAFRAVFRSEDDGEDGFLDGLGPLPGRRARADLVRSGAEPDPDARGVVVAARRSGRPRLVVAAAGLHGQRPSVFVEGAAGAMTFAGSMATGYDGVAVLDLDPRYGHALPEGAPDLEALEGRIVEVRADSGTVLLRGLVPGLHPGAARRRSVRFEDPATGARGSLHIRRGGAGGREVLDLRASGFAPGAPVDLLVEGAGGTLSVAASGTTDEQGRWTLVRDSRLGDPLPSGSDSISSMAGAVFEIRCGDAVLVGDVPGL